MPSADCCGVMYGLYGLSFRWRCAAYSGVATQMVGVLWNGNDNDDDDNNNKIRQHTPV